MAHINDNAIHYRVDQDHADVPPDHDNNHDHSNITQQQIDHEAESLRTRHSVCNRLSLISHGEQ